MFGKSMGNPRFDRHIPNELLSVSEFRYRSAQLVSGHKQSHKRPPHEADVGSIIDLIVKYLRS